MLYIIAEPRINGVRIGVAWVCPVDAYEGEDQADIHPETNASTAVLRAEWPPVHAIFRRRTRSAVERPI